jgi:hypothetical protein
MPQVSQTGRSGAGAFWVVYFVHMRPSRIFSALLAVMAICAAATGSAGAQAAGPAARDKAAPRAAAKPVATRPALVRRDTAQASKSVSQRLFDAGWVVFPARLALVAVCLTIALLLLTCGVWSALRIAHSLRHTKWSEPPRRLKRGEFGAAGTTVAVEWEERLHANLEEDVERDQQIAQLQTNLAQLSTEHKRVAAMVAALSEVHPELEIDGTEIQS